MINLVLSHNDIEENAIGKANESSPGDLLNWLLHLENRGIRVFEDDILKSHAMLCLDISKIEELSGTLDSKLTDDGLFYVDNVGEEEKASEEDKQSKFINDTSNHFGDFGLANVKGRLMFISAITLKLKHGRASLARDCGLAGKLTTCFDRLRPSTHNPSTGIRSKSNTDDITVITCVESMCLFYFNEVLTKLLLFMP
ncbi:hypothetical protein KIW84_011264 [Lathyrus oleraceus]|uniref:Uncharacterized protein n=1 Tax=Pisum sativum TaxID=3888 RepID=A0A9D4YMZ4_PEA|nr:hypothetical protein KIW84_011264 [Pisum sativum]